MATVTSHECQFCDVLVWSDWSTAGEFREREARRIARCIICERTRPVRKPRLPEMVEREAHGMRPLDISGDVGKAAGMLASSALQKVGAERLPRFRVRSVGNALGRAGWTGSAVTLALEQLIVAGYLRAGYRLRGTERVLDYVEVLEPDQLDEIIHPGERSLRQQTLRNARSALTNAVHPVAVDIRDRLEEPAAERLSVPAVRALLAIARHVESGEVLSANVFSARHLGGSKELRRVRARMERMLGPLEALGIRDGGATLLLGGHGLVRVSNTRLPLSELRPYIGLSRDLVMDARWDFPPQGMLVIENMAVFEAACAGDVEGIGEWLLVWSAGYPGRSVRRVVEIAAEENIPVRVWSDLDLDGVRIARLIASWAGQTWVPWRMSRDDVLEATVRRPLALRGCDAIRRDLESLPNAPLVGTLRALLEIDATVEQEVFVGAQRVSGG